ncbi:phospholipase A2 inhibitor-like, partial [Sitodiplosis mosellana]|uniref:phospholipase A2 inhibitor-like n=1 Tax=Sitodiplosis mosellana TaxID=263140 RepID=UPI002443E8A4
MSYLGLTSLAASMFSDASNLRNLRVSHNEITEIPSLFFYVNQLLTKVDLSYNKIEIVGDHAFASDILELLDLSHNQLKTLSADILPTHLDRMKSLMIGNNQLHELFGFYSSRISNMKIVGIDSNQFNCSYLNTLSQMISTNLDSNLHQLDCDLVNVRTAPVTMMTRAWPEEIPSATAFPTNSITTSTYPPPKLSPPKSVTKTMMRTMSMTTTTTTTTDLPKETTTWIEKVRP